VLAIVGNKSDLYINEDISEEVVYNFAHEHGLLFKLVSAKKNLAINELFKEITTLYLQGPSVNDKSTNTINLRNDECKEQHNKKTCC
jgi:GTPase SAR1 family protein